MSCDLDHLYKPSGCSLIGQAVSEEKIFEMVDDNGAWPSYKLTFGSGELKLIATWHSLTPDPVRSGMGGGGGGGSCSHQCFVLKQDILISVELGSNQEAAAPS